MKTYDGTLDICPVRGCSWDFTSTSPEKPPFHTCEEILRFAEEHPMVAIGGAIVLKALTAGLDAYNARTSVMAESERLQSHEVKILPRPQHSRKKKTHKRQAQ